METKKTPKILFVCSQNACRSQMAEGFLRALGGTDLEVASAGVVQGEVHPQTVEVMREVGIDISHHSSKSLEILGPIAFDLVITLSDEAQACVADPEQHPVGDCGLQSALFIGAPARLHWAVEDPAPETSTPDLRPFREARQRIKEYVQIFLEHGYASALFGQRKNMEQLINLMQGGVVVHDEGRNIFLFNDAAERITGRARADVLGKDCHLAFPPDGICGSQCRFKAKAKASSRHSYEVPFVTAQGEERQLKMTAEPLEIDANHHGVLALIRDVSEVHHLKQRLQQRHSFHGIVGISQAIQEVFKRSEAISASNYPVLITGESGTGKELLANAIHQQSRRRGGPFVPINCGALPDNILESELFGHVRGAFTGAIRNKKGRFELAHEGTLFLDEVGELSPSFQVKLLRVLQEKRFEPVGGERTIQVDVRILCATNRDLRRMVREGEFREDLYFRLCVVPIELPPLRNRREDIPLLVQHTLERIREESNTVVTSLSEGAMNRFLHYQWPGNVRELINALQFGSVLCEGEEIQLRHLPPEVLGGDEGLREAPAPLPAGLTAKRRSKLDRVSVERALMDSGGNKVKAARLLGVGRATLYRFLKDNPL